MSNKLAPGLMRLNPQGEIVPCNYDFDTRQIGYIKVTLPMAFATPYIPALAEWSRHDMWKALVASDDVVASILVNNALLVTVSANFVVVHSRADRVRPQVAAADTTFLFRPTRPVGYVRTCPEVKDVNVPPYRLYADHLSRVSVGGSPIVTLADVVPCTEIKLYKMLIATKKTAIFMSSSGPKFF